MPCMYVPLQMILGNELHVIILSLVLAAQLPGIAIILWRTHGIYLHTYKVHVMCDNHCTIRHSHIICIESP